MATKSEPITGTIIGVRDCGTLVIVFLNAEDDRVLPAIFDHRLFSHLLDGEGCGPDELMGRRVVYDGESLVFEEWDQ